MTQLKLSLYSLFQKYGMLQSKIAFLQTDIKKQIFSCRHKIKLSTTIYQRVLVIWSLLIFSIFVYPFFNAINEKRREEKANKIFPCLHTLCQKSGDRKVAEFFYPFSLLSVCAFSNAVFKSMCFFQCTFLSERYLRLRG